MAKEINIGSLMIRFNNEGGVDEIYEYDTTGKVHFHMEQMDDCEWWMRWYSSKDRPLPEDLIVDINEEGAVYHTEPSDDYPLRREYLQEAKRLLQERIAEIDRMLEQ